MLLIHLPVVMVVVRQQEETVVLEGELVQKNIMNLVVADTMVKMVDMHIKQVMPLY